MRACFACKPDPVIAELLLGFIVQLDGLGKLEADELRSVQSGARGQLSPVVRHRAASRLTVLPGAGTDQLTQGPGGLRGIPRVEVQRRGGKSVGVHAGYAEGVGGEVPGQGHAD